MRRLTWGCQLCAQPEGRYRTHRQMRRSVQAHRRAYHPGDATDRALLRSTTGLWWLY